MLFLQILAGFAALALALCFWGLLADCINGDSSEAREERERERERRGEK